jgi:hypothetical protein
MARQCELVMQADNRESLKSSKDGSVIESLTREAGCEPAHVKELYDREYDQLNVTAKVKGFLALLAVRTVQMKLRKVGTSA